METKAFTSKPEHIEGRTVTGIAAVFGNVDTGGDRIHAGAFRKTIGENTRRIRHLWQHDMNLPPIATIEEMTEVGRSQIPSWVKDEAPEVTGGLMVKRTYLETERGNEVLEGIRSGAINEMSIGYSPVKFDYETDANTKTNVRNLRELKLYDTSDVVFGMNRYTISGKTEGNQGLVALLAEYLSNPPECKAGGLALLLQNAAGHLMTLPEAITPDVERTIKSLMDLLSAEPRTGEDLQALTDELMARIELANREFVY